MTGLYRLTSADYSTGELFEYAYDKVGNRTRMTETITSTVVTTYTYDAANRLATVNGVSLTWDNNGNLLEDQDGTEYNYDAANRLVSVEKDGTSYTYTYNGRGDRLSQTVDGHEIAYSLDLMSGLTQVLDDGTNLYLYGLGRIGEKQDGEWLYHLPDGLGSVRQLADADAWIVLTQSFEPFGELMEREGDAYSVYGFTGGQVDGTGLVYLRARYLDTGVGRFLTRDPWYGSILSPETLQGYIYVGNNPINFIDPSGYISESEEFYIRSLYDSYIKDVSNRLNIKNLTNLSNNGFAAMIAARILVEDETIYADQQPIGITRELVTMPLIIFRPWLRDIIEDKFFGEEISWGPANKRLLFVKQNLDWWENHYTEFEFNFGDVNTLYFDVRDRNNLSKWFFGDEENWLEIELQTGEGTANQMALALLRSAWRIKQYKDSHPCSSFSDTSAYMLALFTLNFGYPDEFLYDINNWKYKGTTWDWVEALDDSASILGINLNRKDQLGIGEHFDYLPFTPEEKQKLDTLPH